MTYDNIRLATNRFKQIVEKDFIEQELFFSDTSLANASGLYVFIGASNPYTGSDANVPAPENTTSQETNVYSQMICGKRVSSLGGIKPMARRVDWVANTIYSAYSDTDSEIFDKNFYSVVNAASFYHVFKCLDNNSNAYSTVPPNFSDTSAEDTYYETSDGYVWKYMYSITREEWDSFATREFMPIIPNANVTANAVAGAIDVIKVEDGGAFYSNYIEGQFNSTDIQVSGNTLVYGISNVASSVNGYYTNCIVTILEGKGKGQYREIIGYSVIALTKEIVVNSAFTTTPDSTSVYAISPKVNIRGNGTQTINAVARALINAASSNAVYKIEILERGAKYRTANATVCVNPYLSVVNTANLSVIMPPLGGHGANAISELGSTALGFYVKLSNTESNTIPSDNDYRQIGLIKNPRWCNVGVYINNTDGTSGSNGTFLLNEKAYKIQPLFLSGNVSVNTTSSVITGTGTAFQRAFTSNSWVMIQAGSNYFLTQVNTVANSTSMTLSVNGAFTNASCNIAYVFVRGEGRVDNVQSGFIRWCNTSVYSLSSNDMIMGVNSYAVGLVNTYNIQGLTKTFETFDQRQKYTGTLVSGTFIEDEPVFMESGGSNVATGNFHATDAISGNTKIYITNVDGVFNPTGNIVGNTSGAIFSVTGRYGGDFVMDSGEIMYLENITPVSRSNNQSEIVKIIVEV